MDNGDFIPDSSLDSDFVPDTQQPRQMGGKPPIGFVVSQMQNLTPWNRVNQAWKRGVENFAEFSGKHTNLDPTEIGAALTPVAMAPEILGAVTGWRGAHESNNPTIKGLLNSPEELSPAYAAQNKAIGVTRRIPQEGGKVAEFQRPEVQGLATRQPRPMVPAEPLPSSVPIRYPSKPGDFMAYANNRLQFGDQLNPQELMDWQVKLQTDMGSGVIPKFDPSTGKTTTIFQQATDLNKRIGNVFKQIAEPRLAASKLPEWVMPTRAGLNQANSISNKQQAIQNVMKKMAAAGAAGTVGYYQLKNILQKIGNP